MALNSNALTTVAVCKAQLDIPTGDTSVDALLERYINSASEQIERYCCRKFKSSSYTETRDGSRSNELMLKNFPVTAISSVKHDPERAFGASTELAATAYALIEPNTLRRHSGTWAQGSQVLQITYTAGFSTIPADLEDACIMLVELRYAKKSDRSLGRTSSGKQGESISYTEGWPKEVTDILDSYKVIPFIVEEMARLV
jgi:uncharacterized phiE125 gp8 family phage protein